MMSRYHMIIEWSEADQVFVVTLPEFPRNRTHGTTYEEAARHGQELLELLMETWGKEGRPLPRPQFFPTGATPA